MAYTITDNGNSTPVQVDPGKTSIFECGGTWDSATVKLERLMPDGSTWAPFTKDDGTDRALTDDGGFRFCTTSMWVRTATTGKAGTVAVLEWDVVQALNPR